MPESHDQESHPDLGEIEEPFVPAEQGEPGAPEGPDPALLAALDEIVPYDPSESRPGPREGLRDEEGKPLPEFDSRYREDFQGLMFLGALQTSFSWLGHRFVIRTLKVDELLAVTMLTKIYDDSMGQGLAYKTATAALSVVSIDGKELPIPLGVTDDVLEWAQMRFDFARQNWFQFTVEEIYSKYFDLEERTSKVVAAMGKASARSGSTTG